jgi:hypothetical protein
LRVCRPAVDQSTITADRGTIGLRCSEWVLLVSIAMKRARMIESNQEESGKGRVGKGLRRVKWVVRT